MNNLVHVGDGLYDLAGVDQPTGTVVAQSKDFIALRVPGHKYWSGRGEQGYAPAEVQVFQVVKMLGDGAQLRVNPIIDIPLRGGNQKLYTTVMKRWVQVEEG